MEELTLIKIPQASDFVEEDASAYVEGYSSGATAQLEADKKKEEANRKEAYEQGLIDGVVDYLDDPPQQGI